jgi:signal transduction histidine kinase
MTLFNQPAITEAMLAYVWETAPVLALCLDDHHCVTTANARARQVLGEGILGRPFSERIVDFTLNRDLPSLLQEVQTVHRLTLSTASGMPETLCFRFFTLPEGTLALGSLDFQEQLKLREEVMGLNRDLNDLTRRLEQAGAELRELNEIKNRFIGMAAHDLRTPVGVVMTYCGFILDESGSRLDEEQRGFLRAILNASNGMKRLIDNFLDVAVIESGNLRLERTHTDVARLLGDVWPVVRLGAARKRIELIMEEGRDKGTLYVDVAKIEQVLVNLVGNAVEHSSAGRRVWLAARRDESDWIFSVRDEGAGIGPEDQKLLFASFGRAGTRKTAGERSVGLGLAIARPVLRLPGRRARRSIDTGSCLNRCHKRRPGPVFAGGGQHAYARPRVKDWLLDQRGPVAMIGRDEPEVEHQCGPP